jgi:hypothetical protein
MRHINFLIKFVFLRTIVRRLGLNPRLHRLIYGNSSYEEHFDKLFASKIKTGFIVFDIGASIGHYTRLFSNLVGEKGLVVAFEPSNGNFKERLEHTENLDNVIIGVNCGVGATNCKFWLSQGKDALGATSQIL